MIQWLERHDLLDLWDDMHFIGAFQFVADVRESHAKIDSPQQGGGATDINPTTMEQKLKDAFLKSADKNLKVAVSEKRYLSLFNGVTHSQLLSCTDLTAYQRCALDR